MSIIAAMVIPAVTRNSATGVNARPHRGKTKGTPKAPAPTKRFAEVNTASRKPIFSLHPARSVMSGDEREILCLRVSLRAVVGLAIAKGVAGNAAPGDRGGSCDQLFRLNPADDESAIPGRCSACR